MTAVISDLETRANWRTTATADNPAGPLFSDEYAEADLALQDPMALNCSMATGSRTYLCCA
ncbi:MAG: hypothetical protein QOE53_522 [Pseudonocardiales bacterium]|jgi:hypothetical protein|nr:hypothetical protein [Pseudonocardiales bacterium]